MGPQSAAAVDDTFHFTNCTPQHHEFNAGRTLWLGLEDYVLHNALTSDLKVSVLSGPVLDDGDPRYRGVALPLYWKILAMVRTDGKPSVTAYLLSQSALLDEYRTAGARRAAGVVLLRRLPDVPGAGAPDRRPHRPGPGRLCRRRPA